MGKAAAIHTPQPIIGRHTTTTLTTSEPDPNSIAQTVIGTAKQLTAVRARRRRLEGDQTVRRPQIRSQIDMATTAVSANPSQGSEIPNRSSNDTAKMKKTPTTMGMLATEASIPCPTGPAIIR